MEVLLGDLYLLTWVAPSEDITSYFVSLTSVKGVYYGEEVFTPAFSRVLGTDDEFTFTVISIRNDV